MTSPVRRLASGWQRFWFEPQATSSLALFRIAFGLVATAWTVTQAPNLLAFYGPDGILPEPLSGGPGSWGLLSLSNTAGAVVALFAITLAACVALTLGLFSRVAAVVVWLGVMSFEQRNALVTNSGDGLIRNLAFFCALAPCGAALSVDRLRTARDRFWEFPARAPWALRLIQIQLSIGYLSAVWHKSGNQLWREGTAVSYSLRMADIHRVPTPGFITHSVLITELLTYGTLAVELALGVLVWNRTLRPWVLLLGIGLHVSIDMSILIGFFSLAMLTGYLSFVAPETATRLILGARARVGRMRRNRPAWARPGRPSRPRPQPAPPLATPEPVHVLSRDVVATGQEQNVVMADLDRGSSPSASSSRTAART